LAHDQIILTFLRLGDPASVARELDLPRSSVWYVIDRARRTGQLPAAEP
jgi:hypothetical protein